MRSGAAPAASTLCSQIVGSPPGGMGRILSVTPGCMCRYSASSFFVPAVASKAPQSKTVSAPLRADGAVAGTAAALRRVPRPLSEVLTSARIHAREIAVRFMVNSPFPVPFKAELGWLVHLWRTSSHDISESCGRTPLLEPGWLGSCPRGMAPDTDAAPSV